MRSVSKLGIPLLVVFPFIGILVCVVLVRRRALFAHLLRLKRKSRVEPAIAMEEIESEKTAVENLNGGNLSFWLVMSGPSRALYTIKEDEREGHDVELEIVIDDEDEDDDVMGFSTPCASPEFYTPAASPAR